MRGATLLYNLMLAELAENASRREAHRQALAEWAQGLDTAALAHWSLDAFWHQTEGFGHTITLATKNFVETWVERVRADPAGIADDQVIMKSIALGWPDETFPANSVVSERKSVGDATVFVGFDT